MAKLLFLQVGGYLLIENSWFYFKMDSESEAAVFEEPTAGSSSSKSIPSRAKRQRNKVTTEWSDDFVLELIAAVEPHEMLWNPAMKE